VTGEGGEKKVTKEGGGREKAVRRPRKKDKRAKRGRMRQDGPARRTGQGTEGKRDSRCRKAVQKGRPYKRKGKPGKGTNKQKGVGRGREKTQRN